VDTFDFSQEGMTQFKVGVSQMFPRGKTLSLKREKLQKLSEMQPYARADRNANVAVTVAQLWLDAYRSEQTIQLIERDRGLFEHLVDVAQSSYTTAAGKTRQQDLVRAQLELTRLDDRLARLRQQRDMSLARLGEWLGNPSISLSNISSLEGRISLSAPDLIETPDLAVKLRLLTESLNRHPKVKRIDSKIKAFDSGVRLAKQSYKPQWGVNASYGYRDQTPMGDDRSDFFSVGVSFDVPLFTGKRQDKKVQSANAELEAVKTERVLVLRQLKSGYDTAEATYLRLVERKSLFDTRLLREMAEQAEASLSAYTNDDGDFAEVVRARIAELNARIEALHVEIDMQKNIAQLNYFHAGTQPNKESKSVAF
jgi:outer membrane protein TolC